MLNQIQRVIDSCENEKTKDFISRLFNLLCFFIKKGDYKRSRILCTSITNKLEGDAKYSKFYQSFVDLDSILVNVSDSDDPAFIRLRDSLGENDGELVFSAMVLSRLHVFMSSAMKYITGDVTSSVTDEIKGESSASLAIRLYIEINDFIDDRQKVLNKRERDYFQKDWLIVSLVKYCAAFFNRREYYETDLTKQRVMIADQLQERIRTILVDPSSQNPIAFPLMLLMALDLYLGQNKLKTKLTQRQQTYFFRSGMGTLHQKMSEFRELFAMAFCEVVDLNKKHVAPEIKEVADRLRRNVDIEWWKLFPKDVPAPAKKDGLPEPSGEFNDLRL
jgi:hypothetical protein